ncbi:MAG: glycoside hydrolase family 57 protein, partial [Phycisphaerales bacterium]|nr:glycoside hydrolase family 57 protein [Phycisphaerales bacterium]
MASVVFYFQVHQPYRLRRYSVFDTDPFYFDSQKNGEIARKVADKCYRPMTSLILDLVKRHQGRFRVSYAITGVALDQFAEYTPDVIDIFKRLADTGCCEFVGETYHHSLAFLYSRDEFKAQVDAHTKKIQGLFGQTPTVFRNTELIYSNDIARFVSQMTGADGKPRFYGQICEGTDPLLGYRSPNYLYRPPGAGVGRGGKPFALLLKNYRLSDDIAFRFSNRAWNEWPLTAEKFAG